MIGLPIPAHEAYPTFEGWVDALLLAIPEGTLPYPNNVVGWKEWARQVPDCSPFSDYQVPGAEMIEDWREWVTSLRMGVS